VNPLTESWTNNVLDLIRAMSPGTEFTTDYVWKWCPAPFVGFEPRAMGAAMRKAVTMKLITATDRVQKSTRPLCNRRPVAVWRRTRDRR